MQVQIIPWVISDSNYVKCAAPRLDPQVRNGFLFTPPTLYSPLRFDLQKTVFVGALHGMMTAQGLAMIFQVFLLSLDSLIGLCTSIYGPLLFILVPEVLSLNIFIFLF